MNWPRVTQILKDFGFYADYDKPFIDGKSAMQRGTYVDQGCNILAARQAIEPGWMERHEECEPYIRAFQKFLHEHRWELIDCQREVSHKVDRYIGHYDQRGMMEDDRTVLLSLKTGTYPDWCALQEAFYVNALRDEGWLNPPIHRMALQLKPDGTYTLREFKDPRDFAEASTLARAWWIKAKYLGRRELI